MENEPCYKELVLGTYAAKLNIPNLIKKKLLSRDLYWQA